MKIDMKKLILSLIVISILSLSLVSANVDVDAGEEEVLDNGRGSPELDFIVENLNFLDRLRFSVAAADTLTTIGGALCSAYPDSSGYHTMGATGNRLCYVNDDYVGVAFQIMTTYEGKEDAFIGEKQILKGDKGCFVVEPGKTYYWMVYHCDDVERICTSYYSECRSHTQTKRTRSCSDTGTESVWVDWVDNNVALCPGIDPPIVPDPVPPSPDPNPLPDPVPTGQSGYIDVPITNVNRMTTDDRIRITATFKAAEVGTYLLEGAIQKVGALAVVSIETNECNPHDLHFSNKAVYLDIGTHNIEFFVQPVEGTGKYQASVTYVTGCGGDVIQKVTAAQEITVTSGERIISSCTWDFTEIEFIDNGFCWLESQYNNLLIKMSNVWLYVIVMVVLVGVYFIFKKDKKGK